MDTRNKINEVSEVHEKNQYNKEFTQESLDKYSQLLDECEYKDEELKVENIDRDQLEEKYNHLFNEDLVDLNEDNLEKERYNNKEVSFLEKREDSIQRFLDGDLEFNEVKVVFAEYYADSVNSNRPWSWGESIYGGSELTGKQRKEVCEYAREHGMVSTVAVTEVNGKRYADFSEYKVFECILEKELWNKTDAEQFSQCNEQLKKSLEEGNSISFSDEQLEKIEKQETPMGYTWHHSEKDGMMQLVPYGIHNSTHHHGGRSEGNWADAPR